MSSTRRLFVGIPVPLDIAQRLHAAARSCFPPLDAERLRFTGASDLHMTLVFLGDVAEGSIPALEDALTKALPRHAAVELSIAGSGAFPSPARPRVLWAGVAAREGALTELRDECVRCARDTSPPVAARDSEGPFRAHVTLARVRSAPSHAAAERFFALDVSGEWRAEEVVLFHSVSGAGLSGTARMDASAAERYAKLARFPLSGGRDA
jgi:2'-5' RNA ligase